MPRRAPLAAALLLTLIGSVIGCVEERNIQLYQNACYSDRQCQTGRCLDGYCVASDGGHLDETQDPRVEIDRDVIDEVDTNFDLQAPPDRPLDDPWARPLPSP